MQNEKNLDKCIFVCVTYLLTQNFFTLCIYLFIQQPLNYQSLTDGLFVLNWMPCCIVYVCFFSPWLLKKTPYTRETIVVRNTFIIIAGKQQRHEITNGESYIVRREYFPRVNENTGPSKNWLETAWHDRCVSVVAWSVHEYTNPPHTAFHFFPISLPLFSISLHYFFTLCAPRKSLACDLRDIQRHSEVWTSAVAFNFSRRLE